MQVIKRDGRVVNFNQERIVKAITMAMAQTTGGVDIDLANKIAKHSKFYPLSHHLKLIFQKTLNRTRNKISEERKR